MFNDEVEFLKGEHKLRGSFSYVVRDWYEWDDEYKVRADGYPSRNRTRSTEGDYNVLKFNTKAKYSCKNKNCSCKKDTGKSNVWTSGNGVVQVMTKRIDQTKSKTNFKFEMVMRVWSQRCLYCNQMGAFGTYGEEEEYITTYAVKKHMANYF